jgi:hypothetical protein
MFACMQRDTIGNALWFVIKTGSMLAQETDTLLIISIPVVHIVRMYVQHLSCTALYSPNARGSAVSICVSLHC